MADFVEPTSDNIFTLYIGYSAISFNLTIASIYVLSIYNYKKISQKNRYPNHKYYVSLNLLCLFLGGLVISSITDPISDNSGLLSILIPIAFFAVTVVVLFFSLIVSFVCRNRDLTNG